MLTSATALNVYISPLLSDLNCHVSDNPAVPEKSSPVNVEAAKKWVQLHEEGMSRNCAQKIIDNLQHISFPEFLEELKKVTQNLNDYVKEHKIPHEQVYLVAPVLSKGSFAKSEPWVTSLALKFLNFKPAGILDSLSMDTYLKDKPGQKVCVYFDDASYSGTDLSGKIGEPKKDLTHVAVVPFITEVAKRKLENRNNATVISSRMMQTIDKLPCFSKEEIQYLNKNNISGCGSFHKVKVDRLCLHYFDHKLADGYSVPEKLLKFGLPIECTETTNDIFFEFQLDQGSLDLPRSCFIDGIVPPYKSPKARRLDESEWALKELPPLELKPTVCLIEQPTQDSGHSHSKKTSIQKSPNSLKL